MTKRRVQKPTQKHVEHQDATDIKKKHTTIYVFFLVRNF